MKTLSDLTDLTKRAGNWSYYRDEGFVVDFPRPFSPPVQYHVPTERLAALHPDLPLWWHARLEKYLEQLASDKPSVFKPSTDELMAALNYLTHGGLEFDGAMGNRTVFTSMEQLEPSNSSADETIITGYVASIVEKELNGITVKFLGESHRVYKTLPNTYLSDLYPGWSERHACGVGLGLEDEELLAYTFSKLPVLEQSSLPEDISSEVHLHLKQ